jgi:hypothetical protein
VNSLDLTPILQPILEVVALVIAGLIAKELPRAIDAFVARTGIQLTDQQRAVVLGSIQTAAGAIETKLDQGALQVGHVNINNDVVMEQARAAIAAVPTAAAALGITEQGVARMIVGAVDTATHGPLVATQAAAPQPQGVAA